MNNKKYSLTKEDIRQILSNNQPQFPEPDGRLPSAVMIPLLENEDGTYDVLFEQRALHLDAQPGDICFPGGGMEPGESPAQCAVRETSEELLIDPGQIQVLAALDGVASPSGRPAWPYVGLLNGFQGTFSRDEVDHLIRVPLEWLLNCEPQIYQVRVTTEPGPDFPYDKIYGGKNYPFSARGRDIYFYEYKDTVIWGMTAMVLEQFLRKLKRERW